MKASSPQVLVVGAGLAGLAAATYLERNNIEVLVVEANGSPGGRVRSTTTVEGITLDDGFQVYLEDYPEGRRIFSSSPLSLQRFYPGIYVERRTGERLLLTDPRRIPGLYRTMMGDIAGLLRPLPRTLPKGSLSSLGAAIDHLSPMEIVDQVIAPLFRGATLDPKLDVGFDYVGFLLGRFLGGAASVPAAGMGALPAQLTSLLRTPPRTGEPVSMVATNLVELTSGERFSPQWIVIAVDPPHLGELIAGVDAPEMRGVGFSAFIAPDRPLELPAVFTPPRTSSIYSAVVMSDVAPTYLPPGTSGHLVVMSHALDLDSDAVHTACKALFGEVVTEWRMIDHRQIPNALPKRRSTATRIPPVIASGIALAGDYLTTPSINGALASGRQAALAIARDLSLTLQGALDA
ncbi:MAG: FAD-dependent oxidoreductase [Ferrimicrobium sp.]